MRYYKTADGTTPNIDEIRAAVPNMSIPLGADLSDFGYEFLNITAKPAANPGHEVVEGEPEEVGDQWFTTWVQQPLAPEVIMASIVAATQARLDTFAKTRNYDGILSACTYATSSVPKFQAEGQYCVDVRDATWATLYGILADVQSAQRPLPTGYAAIESELPALVWPG